MRTKFVVQVLHKVFGWITCWGTDTNCIRKAEAQRTGVDHLYRYDNKICGTRIKMFTS